MADSSSPTPVLSATQTGRALRAFLAQSVLAGAWTRALGINTAVYTGYALWLGASRTDVAYIAALSTLASLVMFVSARVAGNIKRKKESVVCSGIVAMLLRFSPILLFPLLGTGRWSVTALYILVVSSLLMIFLRAPLMSDWLAMITPERLRAQFTSQRWIGQTIASMIAGIVFGALLDWFPENPPTQKYHGFVLVFAIALVCGIGANLVLFWAPMPERVGEVEKGTWRALKAILSNRVFSRLLLFRVAFDFSLGMAASFYSVFMLEHLGLKYSTIATYYNIALLVSILLNRPLGTMVGRYGSKPVLQVLLVPGAFSSLFWILTWPDLHYLIPVAFVLQVLLTTGMQVAGTTLMWDTLPERGDRPSYLAVWAVAIHLASAAGALTGGQVAKAFDGLAYPWLGITWTNLHIVFVLTAAALLATHGLLILVEDRRASRALELIGSLGKGNPFGYLYNSLVMSLFGDEDMRVRAAAGMGRSGNPMAAEDLIHALRDLNPDVRRRAAEGLGDLGAEEAAPSLMEELANPDSDIKAEAARALGKIRHPLSLDALLTALEDPDSRVRLSAIRALGEIGGDGLRECLYARLSASFDRHTFPTLVDALSRMGEPRVLQPIMEHLTDFTSPVIRAQLLGAACRAIGAGDDFYRLAIQDELGQARRVGVALTRAERDVDSLQNRASDLCDLLRAPVRDIRQQFESGNYAAAYAQMGVLAQAIAGRMPALPSAGNAQEHIPAIRSAVDGMVLLARAVPAEESGNQEFLFAAVCLCRSLSLLREVCEAGA